MALYTSK